MNETANETAKHLEINGEASFCDLSNISDSLKVNPALDINYFSLEANTDLENIAYVQVIRVTVENRDDLVKGRLVIQSETLGEYAIPLMAFLSNKQFLINLVHIKFEKPFPITKGLSLVIDLPSVKNMNVLVYYSVQPKPKKDLLHQQVLEFYEQRLLPKFFFDIKPTAADEISFTTPGEAEEISVLAEDNLRPMQTINKSTDSYVSVNPAFEFKFDFPHSILSKHIHTGPEQNILRADSINAGLGNISDSSIFSGLSLKRVDYKGDSGERAMVSFLPILRYPSDLNHCFNSYPIVTHATGDIFEKTLFDVENYCFTFKRKSSEKPAGLQIFFYVLPNVLPVEELIDNYINQQIEARPNLDGVDIQEFKKMLKDMINYALGKVSENENLKQLLS
jgi:hypothetical protein